MRAKFRVIRTYNNGTNIVLEPIKEIPSEGHYNPDTRKHHIDKEEVPPPKENQDFFDHSPGGDIRLLCVKPEHASQFAEGKEFFVDFTPAS